MWNEKIKCTKCGNLIKFNENTVVCDKCNTVNFIYNKLNHNKNSIYENKVDLKEFPGNKTKKNKSKSYLVDSFICIFLIIAFFVLWCFMILKYEEKYNILLEQSSLRNVEQIEFNNTIDLNNQTLDILNYGSENIYNNRDDVKIFYLKYKVNSKRYSDIITTSYLKLQSGEYIKPIDSYDLKMKYSITDQEQFNNNIKSRIDNLTPEGILLFIINNYDDVTNIVINESKESFEKYNDELLSSYIMKIE